MGYNFYTQYVIHCLKLYCRHDIKDMKRESDLENWRACHMVFSRLTVEDSILFKTIYSAKGSISDIIYQISISRNEDEDRIWNKIKKLERDVAIERGLYDSD